MAPRRKVRATADFFRDLDRQLGSERADDGMPSRADFQVYELLPLVDRLATGFDDLPIGIPGRPDYRLLMVPGTIVYAVSVLAQLASDGAVEMLRLDIDTRTPWFDDDSGQPDSAGDDRN